MGGRARDPTPKERAITQVIALLLIPLLPVVWVLFIIGCLFVVLNILLRCRSPKEILTSFEPGIMLLVTFYPFYVTYDNFVAFWRYRRTGSWSSQRYAESPSPSELDFNIVMQSSSSSAGSSLYQSYPIKKKGEFRLFRIYPASFEEPLSGTLVITNLSSRWQYSAMSYTWADESGNADRSGAITLEKDNATIKVTKNCEAALRRLRHPQLRRDVWIDANCIDQANDRERNYQVSLMSEIYTAAERVVAYIGEGTAETDKLIDWLNGIKLAELDVPSSSSGITAGDMTVKLERYWAIGREALMDIVRTPDRSADTIPMSEPVLLNIIAELFSRRWFQRVWVLQEVSLPSPRTTTVMCGAKEVSAIRALHLLSLLQKHPAVSLARIYRLVQTAKKGQKRSYLLDILIETRGRECEDPRDKIFGVLSIARLLDMGQATELRANYTMTTQQVYAHYSRFFITHHGLAFFLSLIKSPPRLSGLPSWAADWTVPWPNYRAVDGRDLPAVTRSASAEGIFWFTEEEGHQVLKITRPKLLQGFITRNGHFDGSEEISCENVELLSDDEVLAEMYPGLAALLKKQEGQYIFVQICPHAFSEDDVKELVSRWSSVVIDAQGAEKISLSSKYAGPAETFEIR
ncbi:HET-domain-containing protein [Xylaria sp. FL0933]|nr:HET-domain-containing protein [Xylaria sp. FL0933]